MKLVIVFWNIEKRPIPTRISKLVAHFDVDILILAECIIDGATLESKLHDYTGKVFREEGKDESKGKLRIFSRLDRRQVTGYFESLTGDLTIRRIAPHEGEGFLLCALHLSSKLGKAQGVTDQLSVLAAAEIKRHEDRVGHARTMAIGDFNMNPYDVGLTGIAGFTAVMTRNQMKDRRFGGATYRAFYNPMWGYFGDRTDGPPGTYVFNSSGDANRWQMIDQVLVREALTPAIENLMIVDTDGDNSLLTPYGYPDAERGSDHLPLLIKINTEKIAPNGKVLG